MRSYIRLLSKFVTICFSQKQTCSKARCWRTTCYAGMRLGSKGLRAQRILNGRVCISRIPEVARRCSCRERGRGAGTPAGRRRGRLGRATEQRAFASRNPDAAFTALAAAGFLDIAQRDDPVEVARGVGRLMDRPAGIRRGCRLDFLKECETIKDHDPLGQVRGAWRRSKGIWTRRTERRQPPRRSPRHRRRSARRLGHADDDRLTLAGRAQSRTAGLPLGYATYDDPNVKRAIAEVQGYLDEADRKAAASAKKKTAT